MKNVFSSFLFLLGSNLAFGQIEWVGNHEFTENGCDIIRSSRNQLIMFHGDGLTVLDSVGNIVYDQSMGWESHSEIVELNDATILIFATFFECDLLIGEVIKFDMSWNIEWQSIDLYDIGQTSNFSDNSIAVGSEGISKLDSDGNISWTTYFPWSKSYVRDITITPTDILVAATTKGIALLTINGLIDTTFENLKFERLEVMGNGNFLAQNHDTLLILSADFLPITSFVQHGIVDFEHNQSGVLVLVEGPKLYKLNSFLEVVSTFQPLYHNQNFSSVSSTGNSILFGGNEKYGNGTNTNQATFIKGYDMDGSSVPTAEDVGVVNLTSGAPIVSLDKWAPFAVNYQDIKVTVKNFGSSVVDEININLDFGKLEIYEVCLWDQRATKHFDNLNLPPGESKELTWGNQFIFYKVAPPDTVHFCSWSSLPNHHLETNNDNDVACTEILVAEHEPFPLAFHHYYNAAADLLQLEMHIGFDPNDSQALLFNAAGQLLRKTPITEQRQALEMTGLPDGTYFLQVVSGQQHGWAKVVKH